MKLDSKYFDSIRVSSKRQSAAKETRAPLCQWKGCDKPGAHKAPKGRGRDGEFFHFCMDHVRQYNQEYNYFEGMSDTEVSNFRKDALTGHRPTWKTGANAWAHGTRDEGRTAEAAARVQATARAPRKARSSRTQTSTFRRQLKPLEQKSLRVLDLSDEATPQDIKTRFKELVKIHHPDANGGDSRSEEKLREILQAYNYLKQSGLA
ncbi:MAG: DnaJ domain-containing protein [Proteobacteria bacterium]|nr:DnaJ domain-containing protein [Pseudomonadota bacterium]